MFTIEFVIVRLGVPSVVERMTSGLAQVSDVERSARALLKGVRARHPDRLPDAYQILDDGGRVIVRSWERTV